MAIFGVYETTEELERTPFSVVFKATAADGKVRSTFVIKSLDLDASTLDPHTLQTKNDHFFAAVATQQKLSDRSDTNHWAPIHDQGTQRGRAYYVTTFYPRTVAGMIKGRVRVSAVALTSLVRGVLVGLKELNQTCRRPHGNLKPANILIADPDLDPTEIYLADPLADDQLPHEGADASDMKALGHIIYELVMHRPMPQAGGWPIQTSSEWHRLRRGKDWLAFTNSLLDPLAEKPMTLDEASTALNKLGSRQLLTSKHLAGACIAAAIAVGAFGLYKYIQHGGTLAIPAIAQTKPADPPPPPPDPALAEIQAHRTAIENRLALFESSRDPLVARFPSLLQPAATQSLADNNHRLDDLDTLSRDLATVVEKDYPTVDRPYFIQTAAIHQATKSKPAVTAEDFRRWLVEVKDPRFNKLDDKLDPRKSWQPGIRAIRVRLDELRQMTPAAAEAPTAEVEKLTKAITDTRTRRWNVAQKPLIEQEIKDIDARIVALSTSIDTTVQNQQTADTRIAQLRAKLAANSLILTDDGLQAQWNTSRQQILEDLKKDPGKVDELAKKTTDLQSRLSALDQGLSESAKLLAKNDFIPAIGKLDDFIAAYPDDATIRSRRSSLAAPLYERGQLFLKPDNPKADQSEAFKCLLLSAGLGDARAARMLGRIPPEIGAGSKDSPALLALFKKPADAGDPPALNILGFMYENAWGAAADLKVATDYYTKSANAGFGGAMNNLGFLHYSGRGLPQDNKKAFDWFSKGAAAGYPASMKNLGTMYQNGHGVAVDGAAAAKWYRKAAESNDTSAMTRLGILYEDGKLIERNYSEAATWYRKAAEAGEPRAMLGLATLLESGQGIAKNEADALTWFSKAAAAGETSSLVHLGHLYEQKDDAKALDCYQKAADANDPAALLPLALMYADGRGTKADPKKSVELLKRAAESNDALAYKPLATDYLRGEGVDRDPKEAAKWMAKAADTNDPSAQSNLGIMYLTGQGVEKDERKALELFRKAADAGNAGAMANLGVMYQNGQGVAKDLYESFEWYRKAADAKDTLAMNRLALMYQRGQGTKIDYHQALTWFKAAAEAGESAAMNNLGLMYELGQGLPRRDPAEAAKWFQKAADAGEETAKRNLARVQPAAPPRRDRISRDPNNP